MSFNNGELVQKFVDISANAADALADDVFNQIDNVNGQNVAFGSEKFNLDGEDRPKEYKQKENEKDEEDAEPAAKKQRRQAPFNLIAKQQYKCYNVKCVMIDGFTYCVKCAALRPVREIASANLYLYHSTISVVDGGDRGSLYVGPDVCLNCNCKILLYYDIVDCDTCRENVYGLFALGINNGEVEVDCSM